MMPDMSLGTQAIFRAAYGVLLLCFLLRALPHARRFFLSERWGGYARPSLFVDALHNPLLCPLILVVWLGCACLLIAGYASVTAALVNLLLCGYYFVKMRWRGVMRGMGAPGFMTYWIALAVFLLEYTTRFAPDLRSLALLVLQVDYALIMLSAGIYKYTAGFPRNHGIELGLANPMWGYWWRFYARVPPGSWLFWILNQLGWSIEVVGAVLLLVPTPDMRLLGAFLISASFVFVGIQIRLALLAWMVVICGVLYVPAGHWVDQWLTGAVSTAVAPLGLAPSWLNGALAAALWGYLVLLPFAHAGLWYNFYGRRSFPRPIQRILESYTNFFGIIVWRVFSVNLINFLIRIYEEPLPGSEGRRLISRHGWGGSGRFNHVAESITLTCLFTTLKYYPDNVDLFNQRLLAYAKTLPCSQGAVLVFEYVSLRKVESGVAFVPVCEFRVDPVALTVTRKDLADPETPHAAHVFSPIHEGSRPGSYAPLKAG